MLCDALDLKKYNTVEASELIGMKHDGITHLLGFTNKSSSAHVLVEAIVQYMLDNPNEKVMIYGDFNVHNQEWIHSNTTDSGGILTQEFVELFGLKQIVNFPTRGSNTLDLICSNIDASAAGLMPFWYQ